MCRTRTLPKPTLLTGRERHDGQAMLPEPVRRLILAEGGYFPELRFASGAACVEELTSVIGHADQAVPLRLLRGAVGGGRPQEC
jgi:hypothetical protein